MGTKQPDLISWSKKLCKRTHERSTSTTNDDTNNSDTYIKIENLPIEILHEIFSYLDPQDLHALEKVSEFFGRIVGEPLLWKTYEVKENDPDTYVVLQQLKRMPLLERITIHRRPDCDDILCQLSRSNQKLEKLSIIDCTGSTGSLYLRSSHLTRILERCKRLHTIRILGSRFRGKKFYCLLGNMKGRLKTLSTQATSSQFRAFTRHASHLNEHDKEIMCAMCNGQKTWAPLRYFMIEKTDSRRPVGLRKIRRTVLVSYLESNFLSINVGDTDRQNDNDVCNCP
ncbi:uncharacterized protein [Chelonus insularis]|uniref:uncharacterized protein n=1 Tax=Chelonus insularis TaxID=460826 RepID=UPI00158E0E0E|nr:uncharacterized protein LOC118068022 [Chelonus insularis]